MTTEAVKNTPNSSNSEMSRLMSIVYQDCTKMAVISALAYSAIALVYYSLNSPPAEFSHTFASLFLPPVLTERLSYIPPELFAIGSVILIINHVTTMVFANVSFKAISEITKKTYSLISHDQRATELFKKTVDNLSLIRSNLFFESLRIIFLFSPMFIMPLYFLGPVIGGTIAGTSYSLLEFGGTFLANNIQNNYSKI